MRKKALKFICLLFQSISWLAVKLHIIRPIVVICVDGGICSQMLAYIRGQYYAQHGIPVYYNTRWFETNGMDNFGKFTRPFELLDAFPKLDFPQLSRFKTAFYRHFMRYEYENNVMPDWETLTRSVYLSLYPEFRSNDDFMELFSKYFEANTWKPNCKSLNVENDIISCGVHIRKGDMTDWNALPESYFINSVKYVQKKYKNVKFFFFSDEPDWVSTHIVPQLEDVAYEIIIGNMGYEDLKLCAQCDVIVASQGTMGRFAGLMNQDSELILPSAKEDVGFPVLRYRNGTVIECI